MHKYVKALNCIILYLLSMTVSAFDISLDMPSNELISEAYKIRLSEPTKFKHIVDELESRKKVFNKHQKNNLSLLTAYKLSYSGNFSESEKVLDRFIFNQSNIHEDVLIQSYYLMVYNMAAIKNWQKGFIYTKHIMDMLPTATNKTLSQNALIATATFFNQLEQFELALSQLKELNKFELTTYNQCVSKQLAVNSKRNLDKLVIASLEIEDAIASCEKAGTKLLVNILRNYQADIFIKNKEPQKALSLLIPVLVEVKQVHYPMLTAGVYNLISKAYLTLGNYKQSEKYAMLAIEQHKGNIADQAKDSYKIMYELLKSQEKYAESLHYHEKFTTAEKAYLDEISAKATAFQLVQHQSAQQKSEIHLLNKQNELLNSKNELLRVGQTLAKSEAENSRLIATLLLAIVALLTFFGYRSWRTQRRLKTLAEYDYLTKVYNRGPFYDARRRNH